MLSENNKAPNCILFSLIDLLNNFINAFIYINFSFINALVQVVQIDLNLLQTNYPELTTYLLNRTFSNQSSSSTLSSSSSSINSEHVVPTTSSSKIALTSTSTIHHSSYGEQRTRKPFIYTIPLSKSTSPVRTVAKTNTATEVINNEFLYFNNQTNKFEGVSIQSTYSLLKLTPSINFTLITTSPEIAPLTTTPFLHSSKKLASSSQIRTSNPNNLSIITTPITTKTTSTLTTTPIQINSDNNKVNKNVLPLYHQFIYTVKFSSQIVFRENKTILDLLYEQNIESSKLRVGLMKCITDQLGLNLTSLRLNWIEIVNKNENDALNSGRFKTTTVNPKLSRTTSNFDDDTYFNSEILNSAELYFYEARDISNSSLSSFQQYSTMPSTSTNSTRLKQYRNQGTTDFYHIIVSLSSTNLFDLQKTYLMNLKQQSIKPSNELTARLHNLKVTFESDCARFFATLTQKHEEKILEFKLNLLNLTSRFLKDTRKAIQNAEYLKKVQFLKLCDLGEIYKILIFSENAQHSKHDLANAYIKNSTLELAFNQIELHANDEDEEIDNGFNQEFENGKVGKAEKPVDKNEAILINFKANLVSSTFNHTSIETENEFRNLIRQYWNKFRLTLSQGYNTTKIWFWKIVPEEDFLLAVILPITIIVSMIVLTVVVVCLLHMCNNDYKELSAKAKPLYSANTIASSNVIYPKTPNQHGSMSKANNPIYKQRAYLSKGVPVILYEEMSDKPIEEYDENHPELRSAGSTNSSIGATGGGHGYYYRSPIIMRNEKPPIPAPPEYTKQNANKNSSISNGNSNANMNFLNEIKAMLTQEKITIGESSDESIQMLIHNNYNYPTDLLSSSYKSSSTSESPQPLIDGDDHAQLIHRPLGPTVPLISLKDPVSMRSEGNKRISASNTKTMLISNLNAYSHLNQHQQQQLKKFLP